MTAEVTHSTLPVPDKANRPKTAFVLAGGGSFGSVQVGMLRALVARGVTADMVVGSSVGAMNAAFYAGMPTAEGIEKLAAKIDRAADSTRAWLAEEGLTRRAIPNQMHPHKHH
jgi:predicted acylesterase/phospholipase RssA